MTLYDFVDSIWLGQVEFRNKTSFVLSLCLTLFTVWGGVRISQTTLKPVSNVIIAFIITNSFWGTSKWLRVMLYISAE
jgi:hypothetical protein